MMSNEPCPKFKARQPVGAIDGVGSMPTRGGIDPSSGVDVSFIVAARDVAPFIAEAVASALDQRGCTIEVIVIDDASRDATASVVAEMAESDSRVRLLRLSDSQGVGAARNVGIAAACGDWIAVLDGDDRIAPDRSAKLIEAAKLWSADIVADNIVRFDHANDRLSTLLPVKGHPYSFFLESPEFIRSISPMSKRTNFGYLKPMFKRNLLIEHALSYRKSLRVGEDSQFCLEALLVGFRFLVTSDETYHYRVRPGSSSWRLRTDDIDALEIETVAAVRSRRGDALDQDDALRSYTRALGRARVILRVVKEVQDRRLARALKVLLARPDCWDFMFSVLVGRSRRFLRRSLLWATA